jgi:serine/threonine-protein kinase
LRDPLEGTRYRTVGLLGSGGMGQVYLVEHIGLGKRFVAKVLHERLASDPQLLERIRIEAQALGQLRHPHIVSVSTFGKTVDGRPYIIMEYLQGRTLREELVARGRLPVLEAVTYAGELLSALAAAHAIGIVHRDIKPDNLFLSEAPSSPRSLKVLDFGVARVTPQSPVQALTPDLATESGVVIGTPRWQSPEGAMGRPVDARADVYAAALVLYVMLAGRGPFDHFESDSMVLSAHAVEDAAPPSQHSVAPLPAELDAAVLRALSKDPGTRFQSAADFAAVLERVAQLLMSPASARVVFQSAVSTPPTAPESPRPRRAVVAPESNARAEREVDVSPPAGVPRQSAVSRPALLVILVFVLTGVVTAGIVAQILLRGS